MSFKKHVIRRVIPTYFMIVTFINIGMLTAGLTFFKEVRFGYEVFLSPLLFGFIGCIIPLMEYLFQGKEANQGVIFAQTAFELVVLEVCILGAAKLLDVIDSELTAVIIASMVFVIFVIVCVIHYLQDKALCTEMNKALSNYKAQTEN